MGEAVKFNTDEGRRRWSWALSFASSRVKERAAEATIVAAPAVAKLEREDATLDYAEDYGFIRHRRNAIRTELARLARCLRAGAEAKSRRARDHETTPGGLAADRLRPGSIGNTAAAEGGLRPFENFIGETDMIRQSKSRRLPRNAAGRMQARADVGSRQAPSSLMRDIAQSVPAAALLPVVEPVILRARPSLRNVAENQAAGRSAESPRPAFTECQEETRWRERTLPHGDCFFDRLRQFRRWDCQA